MHNIAESAPYAQAVRGALTRLAYNSTIGAAPKLNAFLIFVVERTLAGDAKSLKAYTIAVGALGKNKDFNPTTDAIVRVEAGRLRQALAHYYANEGATDPVIITIPRGSYVPTFAWNRFREERQSAATELEPIFQRKKILDQHYNRTREDLRRLLEESRQLRITTKALLDEHRRSRTVLTQLVADIRTLVAASTAQAAAEDRGEPRLGVVWLAADNEKFMPRSGRASAQPSHPSRQVLPEPSAAPAEPHLPN